MFEIGDRVRVKKSGKVGEILEKYVMGPHYIKRFKIAFSNNNRFDICWFSENDFESVDDKYTITDKTTVGELREIIKKIEELERLSFVRIKLYSDGTFYFRDINDNFICDESKIDEFIKDHKQNKINECKEKVKEMVKDEKILEETIKIMLERGVI